MTILFAASLEAFAQGEPNGVPPTATATTGGPAEVAPAPATPAPAKPKAAPDVSILVKGFKFTGNKSVSSAELAGIVAPYVGKTAGIAKLREAADKVSEEYSRRGLSVAKAYLPAQEVKDGIVEIAVLEGDVGEITVEGNKNYPSKLIKGFITAAVTGTALTSEHLERGLLLLGDFEDLNVTATLDRGKAPGTVDIVAHAVDRFPLHTTLSFNNFGNSFVSRYHFGLQEDWTNAIIPGAVLTGAGMIGERPDHLVFGSGAYVVPIGDCGTKVGVTGDYGNFTVAQDLADLGIQGNAADLGAFISHPFIRTRAFSLWGEGGLQGKDATYYLFSEVSSRDKIRFAYAGLRTELVHWNGKTSASANVAEGLGTGLGGMRNDSTDSSRFAADDRFTRYSGLLARLQGIDQDGTYSLLARASGQLATESLVASEEWQLGGADSVRGYAPAEAAGDNGYVTSLEFQVAPLENKDILRLVAFGDHGGAYRRKGFPGQKNEAYLTGAGVGIRSRITGSFLAPQQQPYFGPAADLRLDAGFPIRAHKNQFDEFPVLYASVVVSF